MSLGSTIVVALSVLLVLALGACLVFALLWTREREARRRSEQAHTATLAGSRQRTDILATLSHEIRTPMNGIIGVAGVLLELPLAPAERNYVRIIQESGNHLLQLINDILDFSRLDAGRLDIEETAFDVRTLLRTVIDMVEQEARAKGLTIELDIADDLPRRAGGDPGRIRQILLNLIGNAVKFTREGGVWVRVRRLGTEPRGVRVGFEVEDTGIGIPAEAMGKLFNEFTQVDASISRKYGGSGLGLTISRHLVERMGGTIGVESTVGRGSIFRFDILLRARRASDEATSTRALSETDPRSAAEALADLDSASSLSATAAQSASSVPAAPTVTATAASSATSPATSTAVPPAAPIPLRPGQVRSVRVLIAEDNVTNRLVTTTMVTRMGHTVDSVSDGRAAVEAVQTGEFDLVLMDVMMPEMDGLAATAAIRRLPGDESRIAIVGLTAANSSEDEAACRAAGMDHYATKPITAARLAEAIALVMTGRLAAEPPPMTVSAAVENRTFDPAVLDELVRELGPEVGAEVVRLFIETAARDVVRMRGLLAGGDRPELVRLAHSLSNTARSVGLLRVGRAAADLERGVPDAERIASLEALLHAGIEELRDWRA